jgi:hypothetical protein
MQIGGTWISAKLHDEGLPSCLAASYFFRKFFLADKIDRASADHIHLLVH